jgi:hypothetical protein
VDQLGFMGSNLLYPFRKKRVAGMGRTQSGSPAANLAGVWISCLVIFWNLYRATPGTGLGIGPLNLAFYGLLIPAGVYCLARRLAGVLDRR